jgi:hypothetical protein
MHSKCRERFAAAAADASEKRRQAVLHYLAGREREHLAAIARQSTGNDDALRSFVQNVPADAFDEALAKGDATDDLDALIARYEDRERALAQFHSQLAGSVGPRASAIFSDLSAMMQRSQARLREALLDF